VQHVVTAFRASIPASVDFCSIRLVEEHSEKLHVRQGIVQPVVRSEDVGAMVTAVVDGGIGYGATSDLSAAGLGRAIDHAVHWARRTAGKTVVDYSSFAMPAPTGSYENSVGEPWADVPLSDKLELLVTECERLKVDDRIADWETSLWATESKSLYVTSHGGQVEQTQHLLVPDIAATAADGPETQTRTLGGRGVCRQGGLEVLNSIGFRDAAPRIAAEALQLLTAEHCPTGATSLLLMPDQMLLQIHESIGHPLELDRILGDERNYAGTSFVTQDMFGAYRYGSDLLNITFDPTVGNEFASYAFDDEGLAASREFIIRDGVLERPLGASISQHRAGMKGVANSRAQSWNRPPIDRMANLNLEPGDKTLDELIGGIERGVLMTSNCSWSIDDSRNKFQFGCELGRVIEDGELKQVVRNPNYRGISATFWRNLAAVGDPSTFQLFGSPFCGKGEPNQVIRVGHASPACVFSDVEVFGGV